jgi:hypothetical protein
MLVKMHCKYDVDVFGGPKCKSSVGFLVAVVVVAAVEFIVLGDASIVEVDDEEEDAPVEWSSSLIVEPLLVGPAAVLLLYNVSLVFNDAFIFFFLSPNFIIGVVLSFIALLGYNDETSSS